MKETKRRALSRGLWRLLDDKIGSERIIKMRREVVNLSNMVNEYVDKRRTQSRITVGSQAEGLMMKGTDNDAMYVDFSVRVLQVEQHQNSDHFHNNDLYQITVNMEQNNCKPGFTLLKILDGQSANETETSNGIYLSSKKWKESSHFKHPKSTMNGPSTSGILGIFKHDMTEAIKLPIWPKIARGCIQRLLRRGWPDQETVLEMVKQGCHLVPKASRTSKYPDDEWTISFVIAEQILVAKLTHSQFLCYCLLKIFFREAVNDALTTKDRHEDNDTDFLSSYFAKTVVLWEVSAGRFQCNQENLLRNFRRCFRLILNWLSKDYVPNFFIPTNNMLEGKFTEQDKQTLMKHLTSLHKEGYRSFYRCSTLTNKEIGSLQHFGRFFEDMLEGTFKEQDKQTATHLTSLHEEGYRFFYRCSTLTNKEIGSLQHFERFFEDMLEGTFKEQDKQTVIKHKERHRSFVKCSTLTNKEISLLQHFERFSEDRTGLIWTKYPKASEGIQSQFYASLVLAIENHDPCGASHYSEVDKQADLVKRIEFVQKKITNKTYVQEHTLETWFHMFSIELVFTFFMKMISKSEIANRNMYHTFRKVKQYILNERDDLVTEKLYYAIILHEMGKDDGMLEKLSNLEKMLEEGPVVFQFLMKTSGVMMTGGEKYDFRTWRTKGLAKQIELKTDISINELREKHLAAERLNASFDSIIYPPLFLCYILRFLNLYRKGNHRECTEILDQYHRHLPFPFPGGNKFSIVRDCLIIFGAYGVLVNKMRTYDKSYNKHIKLWERIQGMFKQIRVVSGSSKSYLETMLNLQEGGDMKEKRGEMDK